MARPQIENGYTMIANELLEAISRRLLSGDEHRVFWTILRKTYGFKKKLDQISLSQFVLATGINKQNVCRALSKLIKKNMIIKIDNKLMRSYSIQKNYTTWKPLSKQITLSKQIKSVIQIDNKTLSKQITTKERDTKETITKENKEDNKLSSSVPNGRGRSKLKTKKVLRIEFNFDKKEWINIEDGDLIFWKATYPACNIEFELNKMADWLLSNPDKRKTRYRRFISGWLSRTQDRGGSKATSTDEIKAWAEKQAEKEKK